MDTLLSNKPLVIVLGIFVLLFLSRGCGSRDQATPSLGGQKLPEETFQIDFDKRYTVYCSGYQAKKDSLQYKNVRILGFVGSHTEQSRSSSYSYDHFNQWLVLELVDSRKVYLPSNSISIIEEY